MKKLTIISLILTCSSAFLFGQPTADFSMDVSTGCSPLVVNFSDESTPAGEIVSWGWNFYSNDTLHYEQNPSFTYYQLGDHEICLTVTDLMGEEDTHCEIVTVYSGINSLIEIIVNAGCEGENLGAIDITVNGGVEPYSFIWSNGASSEDLNGLSSGPYWVTIADINGCDNTFLYNVPGAMTIDFDSTLISCPGGNDGSVVVDSVFNGVPPYTYDWSNGETTDGIYNLSAGTFLLTITDATDCSIVEEVGIMHIPEMNVLPSINQPNCLNGQMGSLNVFVTGGTFPYSYAWSNGINTAFNPGLDPGIYTLTITDNLGCTKEESYEILNTAVLDLSIITDCPTTTSGGNIFLTVAGGEPPYTYEWTPGFVTTQNLLDVGPGLYQVTVTDNTGCSAITAVELGLSILEMIGGDTIYCDASTAQLEVVAPTAVSYEWSAGNLSCYDCANPIATTGIGETTSYSVTVTEADGCIDIGYINFEIQTFLDFELLPFSNSPVFPGEDIQLDCHIGDAQFVEWTGPGNFLSNDCYPVINNATAGNAGTYNLNIVDSYGCGVSVNPEVLVYQIIESISPSDTFICLADPVQLEVVAPTAISYEWTPTFGLDDPTIANPIATPGGPIFYTVVVTNSNGDQESASVYIDGIPTFGDVVQSEILLCQGDTFEICANITPGLPGIFFMWTGPNGFESVGTCFDFEPGFEEGCYYFQHNSQYVIDTLCYSLDSICIELSDTLFTNPFMNFVVCEGESIEISAEVDNPANIALWQWEPAQFLSCSDCANPIATVTETTIFEVTVIDFNGCEDTDSVIVTVDPFCVWPGDTDTSKVVDNFDLLNIGLAYDSMGPIRPNASLNWVPQTATNWWQTAPDGTNYKHIDTDGNGLINADDTLAITLNWGEVHNFTTEDDDQFFGPNYPQSGLLMDVPFYVDPDTLIEGETYALPIILGEMDNPAENVYGLAFSLEYDSSVIVSGSVSVNNNGWLGTLNTDMIAIQKDFNSPGRVDVGITRIDGVPITGFGELGTLYITIEDDILFNKEDDSRDADELEVLFNITNVLVINHLGEEIPIETRETSAILEETVSTHHLDLNEFVQVRPNPVNTVLYVTASNIKLEKISLYSTTGIFINEWQADGSKMKINTLEIPSGTYLLKVQTDQGVLVKKIVVIR